MPILTRWTIHRVYKRRAGNDKVSTLFHLGSILINLLQMPEQETVGRGKVTTHATYENVILASGVQGHGIASCCGFVDERDARCMAQSLARIFNANGILRFYPNGFAVAAEARHAYTSGAKKYVGVHNLARLVVHLPSYSRHRRKRQLVESC